MMFPVTRVDRKNLNRLREEMLGVGQRQRLGMKDVRVPEPFQGAEIARQESQQVVRIPGKDPRVQQRVAEIPRNVPR